MAYHASAIIFFSWYNSLNIWRLSENDKNEIDKGSLLTKAVLFLDNLNELVRANKCRWEESVWQLCGCAMCCTSFYE